MPGWGGGVKDEGEGEVVVDEGDGDGDRDGVQVVNPPNDPPPSKPWAPSLPTARKAGPIPSSAQVLQEGCAGDQPFFSSPPIAT